jgi:hypothetical protein
MDVGSAALSNAWLQAVARIQSQLPPQPQPVPRNERMLTDVIEAVLRRGKFDPPVAEQLDPNRPGRLVDRLA